MYEVLNIRSLKQVGVRYQCWCGEYLIVTVHVQATPNLRVINMWGVSFVDDSHIEAFSSNCIQLAVTIRILALSDDMTQY